MEIQTVAGRIAYSKHLGLSSIAFEAFLRQVGNINSNSIFVANSIVERRWFRRRLHVLLLDCDGTAEMLGVANVLYSSGVGYNLIQSSPSHYWMVVDKIDTFDNLLDFANRIPGVDQGFLNCSALCGRFSLRLIPLAGRMALFNNDNRLTNPVAIKWYNDFKGIWGMPQVLHRYQAEILKRKIEDKSILVDAADPKFVL